MRRADEIRFNVEVCLGALDEALQELEARVYERSTKEAQASSTPKTTVTGMNKEGSRMEELSQRLASDVIKYEEPPSLYTGGQEANDDDCQSTASEATRYSDVASDCVRITRVKLPKLTLKSFSREIGLGKRLKQLRVCR